MMSWQFELSQNRIPLYNCHNDFGAGAVTFIYTGCVYRQTSNIRRIFVGNKIVDHSNVVGASPVGSAPTTSSFSTYHLALMDWAKTTARRDKKHLSLGICATYIRGLTMINWSNKDVAFTLIFLFNTLICDVLSSKMVYEISRNLAALVVLKSLMA